MFLERVYRQNIEHLEKVRGEWEQEHQTTCEVSYPGPQFPQLQNKKEIRPCSSHFMGGNKAVGWGKSLIPSFIHACIHSPVPSWVPNPGSSLPSFMYWLPLFQAGILHPFLLKPKLRLRQNP